MISFNEQIVQNYELTNVQLMYRKFVNSLSSDVHVMTHFMKFVNYSFMYVHEY